ncbi:hypothetical protein BJ165DRAFT_1404650 [Panaeolus papilionaceus]|nr:hypothetical protein BJ165DRAFT_1404650 [Panaeolus papilionaceus]
MSSSHAVATALIESFNTSNKELFLSLAAPGATWWTSGPAGKVPHSGECTYADHPTHFKPTTEFIEDLKFTASDIIVDEGGRKVVVECGVSGAGVGEQRGKTLSFTTVMIIGLDEEGKIVRVKDFVDHLTAMEFYGFLKA